MQIAAIMKCHGNTPVVTDGLDALLTYVTKDAIVLVDANRWESWGKSLELPVYKLNGFPQGNATSMYKSVTMALQHALQLWPNHDWYCTFDYDVLFVSDSFKQDLLKAEKEGSWCVGFDARVFGNKFPYLEKIIGEEIDVANYLIGCCVFYHRDFLKKLESVDFFNRFLMMTNDFNKGFFYGCDENTIFDFGEYLYPTLAAHYGGKVKGFTSWSESMGQWTKGDFRKYAVRWRPELEISEVHKNNSILHPLKNWNSDVRSYYRELRRRHKRANLQ